LLAGVGAAAAAATALVERVVPRPPSGRVIRQEYGIGDYRRSLRLGAGFDGTRIAADYRQGVLTIRVPRLTAVLPRKIEVRAG
jgi:HSP20 family molecular chaperone IbpA